jgi:hypothetical protein
VSAARHELRLPCVAGLDKTIFSLRQFSQIAWWGAHSTRLVVAVRIRYSRVSLSGSSSLFVSAARHELRSPCVAGPDDTTGFCWGDSVKSCLVGLSRRGLLLRFESAYLHVKPRCLSRVIPCLVSNYRVFYDDFSWDDSVKSLMDGPSRRISFLRLQPAYFHCKPRSHFQGDPFAVSFQSCAYFFCTPSQQSIWMWIRWPHAMRLVLAVVRTLVCFFQLDSWLSWY